MRDRKKTTKTSLTQLFYVIVVVVILQIINKLIKVYFQLSRCIIAQFIEILQNNKTVIMAC